MRCAAEYLDGYARRRWTLESIAGLTEPQDIQRVFRFEDTPIHDSGLVIADPGRAGEAAARHWAYMLSQYYHGEVFALRVCERVLDTLPWSHPDVPIVLSVHADETLHASALKNYLDRRLGLMFDHAPRFARMCTDALERRDPIFAVAGLYGVVEPFGAGSISASLRGVLDPVCNELLERLLRDEGQHLSFGPSLFSELEISAEEELLGWVRAFIGAMRLSSCSLEILRPLAADAGACQQAMARALKGPALRRQARFVGAALGRTLRSMPALRSITEDLAGLFTLDEPAPDAVVSVEL